MSHTTAGFFCTAYVNMGGNGDCGFRSIAAGILDNFFSDTENNEQPVLKALERYNTIFQKNLEIQHIHRLKRNHENFLSFVRDMAFSLRQMAVDEICRYPELYRGAFADLHEETSPKKMRETGTWIDESAIAALSTLLKQPIHVKYISDGKNIPKTLHYGSEFNKTRTDAVVIKLQNGHYIPRLKQSALFSGTPRVQASPVNPIKMNEQHDPDMPEILARIKRADDELLRKYEHYSQRLLKLQKLDDINKEQLLELYIEGMQHSDYLQGFIKHIGVEHGLQDFFSNIIRSTAKKSEIDHEINNQDHNLQFQHELIHALARAMSIGHLDAETVFKKLDPEENFTWDNANKPGTAPAAP